MTIATWVIAGLCGMALFAIPIALAWRRKQIEAMMECRDQFFRASSLLIAEEDVPDAIIRRLEFIARNIANPRLGRRIAYDALSGDLRDMSAEPPRQVIEFLEIIKQLRPELQGLVGKAFVSSLIAVTFTNILLGPLICRVVLFSAPRYQEQAEMIVSRIPFNGSLQDAASA
jgi:hypothetical protein